MIKIAHEAPLGIFHWTQLRTDYDYALVHLFETNQDYYYAFERALYNKREVILDNSIFELGTAFDSEKYCYWINKLKPTWYIIPDVLEDTEGTLSSFNNWMTKFDTKIKYNGKKIGVVQGKNYDQIVTCYKAIEPIVDKIAISFDYSMYKDTPLFDKPGTRWHEYMQGRRDLIDKLVINNIININKPHHLLGAALPQEFTHYVKKNYRFIDSVDTSNPVVHGINRVQYNEEGLNYKITTKLIDYILDVLDYQQLQNIEFNIEKFKTFCR